jgi:hypothetical protein
MDGGPVACQGRNYGKKICNYNLLPKQYYKQFVAMEMFFATENFVCEGNSLYKKWVLCKNL